MRSAVARAPRAVWWPAARKPLPFAHSWNARRCAATVRDSKHALDQAIISPQLDSSWDIWAPIVTRVPLPDGYLARFGAFDRSLGGFKKKHLLLQALTHSSYIKCNQQVLSVLGKEKIHAHRVCNEGLEYLGDAILDFFVSSYLFMSRARADEGQLTRAWMLHAKNETLSVAARGLGLQAVILSSIQDDKGQEAALADCMEALLAAVYLDGGVEAAAAFFRERMLPAIERAISARPRGPRAATAQPEDSNPRGDLQELIQRIYRRPPSYRCWPAKGRETGPPYVAAVAIHGVELARVEAGSAAEAMRGAAAAAMRNIQTGAVALPPRTDTDFGAGAPP